MGRTAGPRTLVEGEWTMAAVAHGAILITVALGPALGLGLLVGPAIVLAIFLAYRNRSEHVARHAVQALAYQVGGGGALTLLGGLGASAVAAAWGISSDVSNAVPIGPLQTSAIPFTLIVAGTMLSVVLSWLAYGLYAALQVYQGGDFRYWLIGDWIGRRGNRDR
jgi:hypothetical protein